MKYQILVDSSADMSPDYLAGKEIGFSIIPLFIYVGDQEYVDSPDLDVPTLAQTLNTTKEKIRTACPSIESWTKAYEQADYTFVVTMTEKLSGTYNSASVARDSMPNKDNIILFNTKSTSGTLELVVDHIVSQIESGKTVAEITESTNEFINTRNLFFILHRFDNLIANGRMSKFAGLVAKTLLIKPICTASPEGTIDMCSKAIGSLNAYRKLIELCAQRCTDYAARKVIITHNNNQADAEKIRDLLMERCKFGEIIIKPMRGLTSFYSQDRGLIICF